MVYALLDDASDTTFVRTSTLQALGIQGVDVKLNLHTMHGNTEIPAQRIKGLTVKRLNKRVEIVLPNAYSRDSIPSRRNQIPRDCKCLASSKTYCRQDSTLQGRYHSRSSYWLQLPESHKAVRSDSG